MTSAEFTAKYRVLKTLTEQGARTQIAQETALGRMVMVHFVDTGTPAERQALVARVGSLPPSGSAKVFDTLDVEGTTVVVTHFLPTFTTFPAWLDEHAPESAATVIMAALVVPKPQPLPPAAPALGGAGGGFTSVFGAPSANAPPANAATPAPTLTPATRVPPAVAPRDPQPSAGPGDFTRVFQARQTPVPSTEPPPATSVAAAPSAPEAPIAPAAAPATPATPAESFTSVFGRVTPPTPSSSAFSSPTLPPAKPGAPRFDSVMPPMDPSPAPAWPAPPPPPPQKKSGDFTQLFERLDAQTPATRAPAESPHAASAPETPPPPAWQPPAMPAPPAWKPPIPAPPSFSAPGVPALPPLPTWRPPGAPSLPSFGVPAQPTPPMSQPTIGAGAQGRGAPSAGGSEFTRIIGRVAPPPPQAFPPPPSHSADANAGGLKPAKSYVPLIIAGNVLLLVIISLVLLVFLKHK